MLSLLGLVGLAYMARELNDGRDSVPSAGPAATALVLLLVAMTCSARAWAALFPPTADRHVLAKGLYTSQLMKYLPAGGGFVQATSQVALSSGGDIAAAAIRLPIFSACAVAGAASVSSLLAFDSELPGWGRVLAVLGIGSLAVLDRRVLQAILRVGRRFTRRLPEPDALPDQRAILRCYAGHLANMSAYSAAFVVLLLDRTDADRLTAAAAASAGWALGYLALPLPAGIGVREGVMAAALPGMGGPIVAASLAHRVLGLVVEASLAGMANLRAVLRKPAADARSAEPSNYVSRPPRDIGLR